LRVSKLEKDIGIEVYASKLPGIGGKIRQFPEDFLVEEVLVDGSKAKISGVEAEAPKLAGGGRYLTCILVKRNWDTIRAVKKIAKRLGISPQRIQFAGIKDAKAVTAQHISIRGIAPEQLGRVRVKGISLRPLGFSGETVFPHLLFGNQFRIIIRAVSHHPSTIEKRLKNIQEELLNLGGVPNFFGHQRFGTVRPVTHLVGKFLVRNDLRRAALTFLARPSPYEHPESREARKRLGDTQNFEEALRYFPSHLGYERSMLDYLAKKPNDFVGAFRRLPTKLCQLFVQAYQSFLFNRFLSERIKRGLPLNEAHVGDYAVNLDANGLPTSGFTQATSQSLSKINEAIKENKMVVAIPLVGFRQPPSGGIQGEIEREILEAERLVPQDFKVSSMPETSAAGELRTAITPTVNLSIEEPSEDSANPHGQEVSLDFTLHRGCYATVVLREFMKPQNLIEAGF